MKVAWLILFSVIAIAINEVYSADSRCGSFGRKRRQANNPAMFVRMQTFYKYNKGSNLCVTFQSPSASPGNAGFSSQSECQRACVQRPLDSRCGTVKDTKPDPNSKMQTFYKFDKNRNACVSYQSASTSLGSTGFRSQDECQYKCVQRNR